MFEKYKVGLVLGGGGARGIAHLGVAKAMYELGLKPDVISGVSAGSIAGSFLAAGLDPEHVYELIKKWGFLKYSKIVVPKTGLFKLTGLAELLQKEISQENIEDLPIDFWIAVSNITDGKVEYFNSGSIYKLVMASSSIPIIFEPVKMNGTMYVDGGLYDNLPVEPIKDDCKRIIAVNLEPHINKQKIENLFQVAVRTFHLSVESNTRESKKACDVIIEPSELNQYDILQIKEPDKLFNLGYRAGIEKLKDLKIPIL
ncbi:patatin-like phospholipase family protein [Saccharicrinis sp. FJH62]|uniref:patatin-like phospholipase family protein n=1 Tax=Saccharicrinis sp. FJH62 TaxID=3344657 RepID=UPI0035D3FD52